MKRGPDPSASRRGMALVMVLWLLAVLCAVALEVSLFSRLRLQATRNSGDAVRALFLARAGVERAVADLDELQGSIETTGDLTEGVERIYQNVELGGGHILCWRGPGTASVTSLNTASQTRRQNSI